MDHGHVDQLFRIEEGNAKFVFDSKEEYVVGDGGVLMVLAR
jgi:mannose-6-phosphate isomerase-like protein (cupin superfamily)